MQAYVATSLRRLAKLSTALVVLAAACDSVTPASGRVVDASGRPIKGALVVLHRAGAPPDSLAWVTHTDSAGRFEAMLHGGLRSSDVVLTVCIAGNGRTERRIPDAAQVRDLVVSLAPTTAVGENCRVPTGATVVAGRDVRR